MIKIKNCKDLDGVNLIGKCFHPNNLLTAEELLLFFYNIDYSMWKNCKIIKRGQLARVNQRIIESSKYDTVDWMTVKRKCLYYPTDDICFHVESRFKIWWAPKDYYLKKGFNIIELYESIGYTPYLNPAYEDGGLLQNENY